MSAADTKALIAQAVGRLQEEVPSLRNLSLVIRLELATHGGDAPIWRVEVPGPKVDRDPAGDARVNVIIQRKQFNMLATEGKLRDWQREFENGHVKATGDISVVKLLGSVFERQLTRTRA
jgi:hypothetical protein